MTETQDCIFCRIASGAMGTQFVYETETVVAFDDLAPQADTHVLVIPRVHVSSVAALSRDQDALLGDLVDVANQVARNRGIDETGYRLLANHGSDAGQTVFHLHLHLLGGNQLGPLG